MHVEKKYWGDHNVEYDKVYFNSIDDTRKESTYKSTSKPKLVFKNEKMAKKMHFQGKVILLNNECKEKYKRNNMTNKRKKFERYSFVVEYVSDGLVQKYVEGKNILKASKLYQELQQSKEGDLIEFNGQVIYLIKKEII